METAAQNLSTYTPRRPQDSILFKVVNDNLEAFLKTAASDPNDSDLPIYVKREFEKFLGCGFYENGVTRVSCKDSKCGDNYWLPTSCKCRGFCPSCGGRRMNEFAINIDERVMPEVPVRQYVISVPFPMRYWLMSNHELTLEVNRIIIRSIRALLRKKSRRKGVANGVIGAVTFMQRFGSGLNSHPHYHILVVDGVFTENEDPELVPEFIEAAPFDDCEIAGLARRICTAVRKHLIKSKYLEAISNEPNPDLEDSLDQSPGVHAAIKKASLVSRIALGPRAGQKVRRIGPKLFGVGDAKPKITGDLCAEYGGFSVHANTRVPAKDRARLKRLISYVSRPSVSLDRLSFTENGDIEVKLKSAWPDGTTALVLSPFELIEKLAALVPYPQKNLVIYSGFLAPNHSMRRDIVPLDQPPEKSVTESAQIADVAVPVPTKPRSRYIPWAVLLKKTWGIDVFSCRTCGGPTSVRAFISDPAQIQKIMAGCNLHSRPPPVGVSIEVVYDPDL
jgi:hypothetical protein